MDIEDGFICDIQTPIDISFTENVAYHYINSFVLTTSRITDNMPCVTGSVYSTDSTTIYIEMTNPITSISANENIKAFEITATFGGVRYVSRIKLTVTDMCQVSGEVNILYKSELGNIKESAYDAYIESFNRAFTYTMNYLEGE